MSVLEGIKVADFTSNAAGPYCTMLLAAMGATVIKVEAPNVGDSARHWGTWHDQKRSFLFLAVNYNKKSVTLNLKSEEGRKVAYDLIKTCDVVVESLAPGATGRLGIDYDAVKQLKEDIIYCSVSGFGRSGPLKDELGFDMMLQAYSGILGINGQEGMPPVRVPISALDLMTGSLAYGAIVTALLERQRSGRGQWVETSLYDSAMSMLCYFIPQYTATRQIPRKSGGEFPYLYPYGVFKASDDYFFLGIGNDREWERFCASTGLQELAQDERFKTNQLRVQHRSELRELMNTILGTRPAAEWVALLKKDHVPTSIINKISAPIEDAHAHARQAVIDIPGFDGIKGPGIPFKLAEGQDAIWGEPPMLGAHNQEVLTELGYSTAQLEELKERNII